MKKKIIASVISDIVTDQRVQKECATFHKLGYDVLLLGRKSNHDFGLDTLPYKVFRFYDPFKRGAMMYALFNLQLFFYLLFKQTDILWANDLDTLLPNYLVAKLKRKVLVYDSHEYFLLTVSKKFSRKVFGIIERYIFPKLRNVITVNNSIKDVYEKKYAVPITVIRNVPLKATYILQINLPPEHSDKRILLMQGIGLNENRGAEEAVEMMQFLPENYVLYFIGRGTILHTLKRMVAERKLDKRIIFTGVLPYAEMMAYTRLAYLGLIFEKIDFNDEHMFSLPNKFFDYIKGGLPVLSSKAVEIKAIIDEYKIGTFIDDFEPRNIARKIIELEHNEQKYLLWKQNLPKAAEELNWENEEVKLIGFIKELG